MHVVTCSCQISFKEAPGAFVYEDIWNLMFFCPVVFCGLINNDESGGIVNWREQIRLRAYQDVVLEIGG